jgi:secreted PhoX family phosphatase
MISIPFPFVPLPGHLPVICAAYNWCRIEAAAIGRSMKGEARMRKRWIALASVVGIVVGVAGTAIAGLDFGQDRDAQLNNRSNQLFGILQPVPASSTTSVTAQAASADPRSLATFAKGLSVRVVTSGVAGPNLDMISLWPNDTNPTTLIECNEQGSSDPGLQRIDIATGDVATIATGTISCDPTRRTPWGTIVFAEENGTSGRLFELIDPLHTTGVTINPDGTTSGGTGANNIVMRSALGNLSFEGLAIYANGLVYYGDENRPGNGIPGGAFFKFVPTTLRDPNASAITSLSDSPLAAGAVYGLRIGQRVSGSSTDYGMGTNTGLGSWVGPAGTANLRAFAQTNFLTAYYRPEDIDIDRGAESGGNVKFCGNNTGDESSGGGGHTWGETVCITDGSIASSGANTATPELQYFVINNSDMAMTDNVAYQPGRGNWILHEDGDIGATGKNNDLWDCLPDGADSDSLTDGCVRIGTLNDLTANGGEGAEWTGGIFDATGTRFFVSVQHNVTGHGVVLEVTGWK